MLLQLIDDFLKMLRYEKRYSLNTLLAYENDLKNFASFLQKIYPESVEDLSLISHHQIRSWLVFIKEEQLKTRKADIAAKTLNRKTSSLNSFYKYLQIQGILETNPVKKLHAMRVPERLPTYLKEDETENLLEEISFGAGFKGFTNRLICELLYNTGMRRQELINLKVNDIEWSLRQLRVLGKGNKERLIPIGEAMLDTLRDYLAEKEKLDDFDTVHLLVLKNGQPIYTSYVYRVVKENLSQVSTLKKKSPHVLRHTFATHLLNNGASIQSIKELLGHSSLASTQIYAHNSIAKLKHIHQAFHPREQKKPKNDQ